MVGPSEDPFLDFLARSPSLCERPLRTINEFDVRIGASDAPSCVIVAKGDDDIAPTQRPPILSDHPGSQRLRLIPSTEDKRPSAPVTAGDPDLAKTGVVAHGALDILKECSNDPLQHSLLRLVQDRLRL